MFSNDYNREIADKVDEINKKFITHQRNTHQSIGSGIKGGKMLLYGTTPNAGLGRRIGGAGGVEGGNFFSDIFDGIKHIFGGSIPNELLEPLPNNYELKEGGANWSKFLARAVLGYGKEGSGIEQYDDISEDEELEGGRKKRVNKKGKGIYEQDDLMQGSGLGDIFNYFSGSDADRQAINGQIYDVSTKLAQRAEDKMNKKKGGSDCKCDMEGGKKKYKKKGKGVDMEGGNFLDDLVHTVGSVADVLPLIALGKPKKKGKGVDMEGGKKREPSSWVKHILAYSKKTGKTYKECLTDAKCKSSYKKK
jgi:hypothetical protein